jgi:CBS domain-containing protein
MLIVRDLLRNRPPPHVLSSELSALEAARFLRRQKIGGAPVGDHGRLVGFCSERDLVFGVLAEGRDPTRTRVVDVMTRDVVTCTPDDSVADCEQRVREKRCRHLPVIEGGRILGCLSLRDFLQSELREKEAEVEQLSAYIRGAGA